MDRQTATAEIKARWKELYPADGRGKGKGIICPLCGSGSGKTGTGISAKPNSPQHFLKCWNGGCSFSEGGSVIDLYMLEHGMNPQTDFSKAVDELAARLNIRIDQDTHTTGTKSSSLSGKASTTAPTATKAPSRESSSLSGKASTVKPEPEAPHADYSAYYQQCISNLFESAEAQAYLRQRGIDPATAAAFGIGFDPQADPANAPGATGNKYRPHPCPRIIIPSSPMQFVGRSIDPATPKQFLKMNNKGGQAGLFHPELLYHGADCVFVTEGAFDALSVLEVGNHAIALNSTSNVDLLLEQLEGKPTKSTLIICLDNDEAGKKAADKLKDGLRRLNICYVSANITGDHKDPNEALTADRAAFEQAIAQAIAAASTRPDNTASYLDNLMAGEIDRFKQAQDRKTGFANLDEKAGGLNAGLYVLAAISSLGKTTLALQMADQIAAQGQEVLFFSMEQSRLEMVSKSLARITAQADMKTAVTSLSIRRGQLPEQVLAAVKQYKAQTGNRLSIIEGNFNCDIGFIGDYIRRYREKTGTTPVCFVDYLQILQPAADGKSRGSRKDEIDLAVTELKRLSRELNATIIVISSLNRANYLTPFAFESLKESGGIEYTADVVWGLQLQCLDEDIFNKEGSIKAKRERISAAKSEDPRKVKLVCLKNRYGISNYECAFSYYPRFDLFVPASEAPQRKPQRTGGKNT